MSDDLLVITPSRGRSRNIARLLDSVHQTRKLNTHVHVAVDDDDPELENYRQVMEKAAQKGDKLTVGPRQGLTAWTNQVALANAGDYPFLASLGDDHVPRTPGWDRALVNAIKRIGGTGFAYPWSNTREDVPEAVVMSSDIVTALGWMALPECAHWYIDVAWGDLGRGIGRLAHLRAIKVDHLKQVDQTAIDQNPDLSRDREAYFRWRREQMADDIDTIRKLKDSKCPAS